MNTTMAQASDQIQYHISETETVVPLNATTMYSSNSIQQQQFVHGDHQLGVVRVTSGSQDQVDVPTHHIVAQVTNQQQNANEIYVRHPVMEVETVVSLEQCCSCSTFFEAPARPIPQPDLNRMICKILDVTPDLSFYREYLALCVNCINLLRKFDRLRVELEFVKTQMVTYVMESLTQIKAEGGSQLDVLRDQIMDRWAIGQRNFKKKGKEKEGFTAAGTNGDLSWAAHNNVMRSNVIVTMTPSENWTPRSDADASAASPSPPNSPPAATEFSNDNDDVEAFHNEGSNDEAPEAVTENVEEVDCKTTPTNNKNVRKKALTGAYAILKPKRKKKVVKKKRTGPEMVPLICVNCGRIFSQRISYNGHIQACTSDDLNNEKSCSVCQEEQNQPCLFETWEDYKTHVDTNHPLVILETCTKCSTVFLPNGLKYHSCWHSGHVATEAIFKCDRCDRAYNTRGNLVDHVRRVHKDEQHKCDICEKVYGSPMLLGYHMERHKRVVSKFQCKYCGICLSTNYGLKEHTKRHTGEKPAECKECGKKFASRSILRTHKTIHTTKKPHVCHICGKGFKLRSSLSRHIPRHQLKETNYTKKCPLCPKSMFRRIWVLKKHMETSHPGTAELNHILEKYKNIDDAPKDKPLRHRLSALIGKGRAESVKPAKDSDEDTEEESDVGEDEINFGENSGAEDVKPTVVENEIQDKEAVLATPARQSARLISKSTTKPVLVLSTKVSSKSAENAAAKK